MFYREYLIRELAKRNRQNSAYSMRAFSRALDVSVASLSQVLSGKRPLSLKAAIRIAECLEPNPKIRGQFLESVFREQVQRPLKRKSRSISEFTHSMKGSEAHLLGAADIHSLPHWYSFAILELIHVHGFQPSTKWVAQQLGVSYPEIMEAVSQLKKIGLLQERDGKWIDRHPFVNTRKQNTTNHVLRNRQKQIREKAIESLDRDPIEIRSMTSMVMAIQVGKIEAARKKIQDFQNEMAEFLSPSNHIKDAVYALEIGLFPLQRLNRKTIVK